jgi:hypothetical protein
LNAKTLYSANSIPSNHSPRKIRSLWLDVTSVDNGAEREEKERESKGGRERLKI